jgi:hypothetical protein
MATKPVLKVRTNGFAVLMSVKWHITFILVFFQKEVPSPPPYVR